MSAPSFFFSLGLSCCCGASGCVRQPPPPSPFLGDIYLRSIEIAFAYPNEAKASRTPSQRCGQLDLALRSSGGYACWNGNATMAEFKPASD